MQNVDLQTQPKLKMKSLQFVVAFVEIAGLPWQNGGGAAGGGSGGGNPAPTPESFAQAT